MKGMYTKLNGNMRNVGDYKMIISIIKNTAADEMIIQQIYHEEDLNGEEVIIDGGLCRHF
jgi:hypothetical protein